MAVTSPSIPGITVDTSNTTSRSVSASFSGGVSGRYYRAEVYRAGGGGTMIASGSRTGAGTISIAYTHSNVLTRLEGASSFGWQVTISEWYTEGDYLDGLAPLAAVASGVASITITLRYTAVSHSNAPYDMDAGGQIQVSWTRPSTHTAWRARIQFYIGTTLAFTRSGYSGAGPLNFTPTAEEIAALESAMGGTSPQTMTIRLVTGFALSSNSYFSGYISSSQTNNLIKLYNTVKVWLGSSFLSKPIKVCLSGSTFTGKPAKAWTGSAWKNAK